MDSVKKTLLNIYRAFNNSLKALEAIQVRNPDKPLPYPIVFILGAPRSGTTLLYQSLVTAFDFSYFSNAHCRLFGAPWLVERALNPSSRFQRSSFRSRFGTTSGWNAPSECGDFWYRFFPRHPQYVGMEDADPKKMTELRASVHAFLNASGKPLLIKNLPCALRLEPLCKVFPEAVFLVVCRNETDTAHSILESREKLYGSYERWFSLEPPDIGRLKSKSVPEQVIGQIRAIGREIGKAEEQDGSHRFMRIRYEEFCAEPNKRLEEIQAFLSRHGLDLVQKTRLPESFDRRTDITIDKELYDELVQYIKDNPGNE